jgi:hypothetical protein
MSSVRLEGGYERRQLTRNRYRRIRRQCRCQGVLRSKRALPSCSERGPTAQGRKACIVSIYKSMICLLVKMISPPWIRVFKTSSPHLIPSLHHFTLSLHFVTSLHHLVSIHLPSLLGGGASDPIPYHTDPFLLPSVTIAKLCKPDANLTHHVCRARKDDAEVPARLETLARKDEHGLFSVQRRAEVDVAVERGERVRVDADEHVQRAGWRGAREAWDAFDSFVHDFGVELSGSA